MNIEDLDFIAPFIIDRLQLCQDYDIIVIH